MKKVSILFIKIAVISIFFTACASNPKRSSTKQIMDNKISKIDSIAAERKINTKYYSDDVNVIINAKINIKLPNISNSANATIEMAKRDSILITITGPFGISVGKLYANPEQFFMLNNLEGNGFTGIPSAEQIGNALHIPISYNDIVSIFRTTCPQNINDYHYNNKYINDNPNDNYYCFTAIKNTQTHMEENIYFNDNNDFMKLERIANNVQVDSLIIMSVDFSQHYSVGNFRFAKKIIIIFPAMNGKIEINISSIKINENLTNPMMFKIPKSYQPLIQFE
jgi:hypothetical protein